MILIIVIVLFLIYMAFQTFKRYLYFYPSTYFIPSKETYTEIYENNLHAWYKKNGEKVVLYSHGNAGNISLCQNEIEKFLQMGCSVLAYDYPSFGKSKGVPSEQSFYESGEFFLNYLIHTLKYRPENIILVGFSMGACVASYLAFKYSIPKLILINGLTSIRDIISSRYSFLKFVLVFLNDFNTVEHVEKYKGKSLVIHSLYDEIVPFSCTKDIRKFSSIFIECSGSHNKPDIPWETVEEFIVHDPI